ncbi:MAG: ABC transporter ATP-binding protein [Verrucomicrobiota bacterium]
MSTAFLEIHHANVWRGEEAERLALEDVSLEFHEGESVAILGPNGAGKSTLLKVMTGELRPEWKDGMVCRLFGGDRWIIDDLRARIGVIMADHLERIEHDELALDVVLSSFRGAFGRTRWMRFSKREKALAKQALEKAGVAHLGGRFFNELSSGEQRRVMIARAVAHDPSVIVLDEPSTALDFAAAHAMGNILRTLQKSGHTLVWVTHHPGEIPPEIDRVILLKNGRVFADGKKRTVLASANLSSLYEIPVRVTWTDGWCSVR